MVPPHSIGHNLTGDTSDEGSLLCLPVCLSGWYSLHSRTGRTNIDVVASRSQVRSRPRPKRNVFEPVVLFRSASIRWQCCCHGRSWCEEGDGAAGHVLKPVLFWRTSAPRGCVVVAGIAKNALTPVAVLKSPLTLLNRDWKPLAVLSSPVIRGCSDRWPYLF